MTFKYEWLRQEANFGPVIQSEVPYGTHFTIESVLKYSGKYIALRRPEAVPHHEIPPRALSAGKPLLYFVHALPLWGESLTQYVDRAVHEQAGVGAQRIQVVDLTMALDKDSKQWALTPFLLVELSDLPTPGTYGNPVTEVVAFTSDSIPDEFGCYTKTDMEGLIRTIESSH